MSATYRAAKLAVLHAMRLSGAFSVCERLTSGGLQILCYHGISQLDEHQFKPKLFMREELFAARIDWLAREGYQVLALEDAVHRLDNGELPRRAVVITFDDGWYGCLRGGFDKLVSLGYPATMYVTTYYAQKRCPVFNVAVAYVLWRGRDFTLNLKELNAAFEGQARLPDPKERAVTADRIADFGHAQLELQERVGLLYRLAELVALDPVDLFEHRRVCTLMNQEELMEAASMGIDIQLHTHRHRLPLDNDEAARQEIADNRAALQGKGGRQLTHLCYPSGIYHPSMFPVLRSEGIRTATTTEAGLNFCGREPLALKRFLDGENIGPIEFHGELAGAGEVLRQLRAGHAPWSIGS